MRHLRKWLSSTVAVPVLLVALFTVQAGLAIYVYVDSSNQRTQIAEVAFSTNRALCVFRHDLEQRVEASRQFLADHPDGLPGIPAASIQQNINTQQSTIDALSDLHC